MSDIAIECSPFFDHLITRHFDWFEALRESGRLDFNSPPQPGTLQRNIKKSGLEAGLRQFRNREMMRLIWRDLNQQATLEETLSDLSVLAEVCLEAAVKYHGSALEEQHGIPRNAVGESQKIVVIGLGKLGGFELNMSSDIDIIFCYPDKGVCDGRRALANEQFFTRLARKVIHSLSQLTADGFCFRVDTRLRPFGESGPLVSSFAALEQYYQREGRDWERYALIKARPVAGDLAAGQQLLGILKPFVYRRYIDFGAIEALRDMHHNVREDALRHDRLNDIKRGPGGIREIEFLVQTFQLLRGGREITLQTPSIFMALSQLQELQLLPESTVTGLLSAYRFLRNVENRIQALHDQQTHVVADGEDGLRVARGMGFEATTDFLAALCETRDRVQLLFEQSLPQPLGLSDGKSPWHILWQRARDNERDAVAGADGQLTGRQPLAGFIKRLNRLSLSQRASRRLDQFMPLLLERIDSFSPADEVVNRVFDLVSAICRRSAYLSLLLQNPQATDRMLELFAASKRVATAVTRHPALLDELIDPSLGAHPPTREEIQAGIRQAMKSRSDTEATLQNLNYLKQAVSLRIAVAALRSTMTVYDVQTVLSQLAENLIGAALTLSLTEMEARHGRLPGPELAVIAYGSLGACALGFDSDLDLIFLYRPEAKRSEGARPIHAEQYHTGVARRLLSLLSATTPSGRLYSIDARLRPNGRAGLLVSSVEAFGRYQQEKAWVWELQALTRARPVAGNADVMQGFSAARQLALTTPRDPGMIGQEVQIMRKRVAEQHVGGDPLKHGPGGLMDIEFVVQLGLLLNSEKFCELLETTRLNTQLRALLSCGWLDNDAFQTLDNAYTQLSQARQEKTLVDDKGEVDTHALRAAAKTLCGGILG
ncbi:MAG: bifunctional [glutamate--ammonia ligase]-adenylyl-L-tyrosine phosphorylase/[glutamate--ammonia-ligase] adenylyltransferase [Gammaproteobacteria bacterium]|nr:MAG: bifunctional [glutamate--ammonia ligase]-adenylyl-L-tyrosine phosphorylase/[glutamate--ammonia-ligase] adenylyltransferase [Gammaproteobacteria bacterium]